jgi:hypothetical protein
MISVWSLISQSGISAISCVVVDMELGGNEYKTMQYDAQVDQGEGEGEGEVKVESEGEGNSYMQQTKLVLHHHMTSFSPTSALTLWPSWVICKRQVESVQQFLPNMMLAFAPMVAILLTKLTTSDANMLEWANTPTLFQSSQVWKTGGLCTVLNASYVLVSSLSCMSSCCARRYNMLRPSPIHYRCV